MSLNFNSVLFFKDQFDITFADTEKDLLIIDETVASLLSEKLRGWKHIYPVIAGESLKEWKQAVFHIERLTDHWGHSAHRKSRIIVCGGGSVGDFGGFYASILKRGVELIHIPTTWLASIDSAHGGKTGLNINGAKNQFGTFYPAKEVHIFKDVLWNLPYERAVDGFGEYLKMQLIENGTLSFENLESDQDLQGLLWNTLDNTILKKYDIILKDPFETLGQRLLLNLGHSFGHILEAETQNSHGLCVLQGLDFCIKWSLYRGSLLAEDYQNIVNSIKSKKIPLWSENIEKYRMRAEHLKHLFYMDKKSTGSGGLNYIFVKSGGCAFSERVTIDDFIQEAQRQGWVY